MHQIQRTTDMKIPEPDSFQMRTCIWMHHISKDLIPVGVKNLELHSIIESHRGNKTKL
jgi:hypothetical protein